ncbi:MAG: macro domain-containing protein [Parachlamydiales bacterium]
MTQAPPPIFTEHNAIIAGSCLVGSLLMSEVVAAVAREVPLFELYSLYGLDKYRITWLQQMFGLPLLAWSLVEGKEVLFPPQPEKPPLPPKPRLTANVIPNRVAQLPKELDYRDGYDRPIKGVGRLTESSATGCKVLLGSTTLELQVGDIGGVTTEAVVNAANNGLSLDAWVAGVAKAFRLKDQAQKGSEQSDGPMAQECKEILKGIGKSSLQAGEAALTCGWKGGPKWAIHAVGPTCGHTDKGAHKKDPKCPTLLRQAYWNSLELAEKEKVKSITFPFLSGAIYGYHPEKGGCDVALRTMQEYFRMHPNSSIKRVVFINDQANSSAVSLFLKAVATHCTEG